LISSIDARYALLFAMPINQPIFVNHLLIQKLNKFSIEETLFSAVSLPGVKQYKNLGFAG